MSQYSHMYGKHAAKRASPLRIASNASSNSDTAEVLPRSRNVSSSYQSAAGHKRGLSDRSPERATAADSYRDSFVDSNPRNSKPYRESLRTLAQAPAGIPSASEIMAQKREDVGSVYGHHATSSVQEPEKKRPCSIAISRSDSKRGQPNRANGSIATSQAPLLESSEFEQLGKSSTGHLRALSKFAESGADSDFAITSPDQEVVGLHGRRRLQRNMSTRGKKPSTAPGYGGKIWMDQQRQFLQAYEYLCHIGEAKEWIEDIIHKPIPPIVQLEEALRDGVTLAEVVQALTPRRTFRIFHNPKLQFRHSDNIAIFFRFLADSELPELFRFELVDLYEKKNIPKVIYCIHALSWLLFRQGVVDFRIGNLVGKLEFEDHELEAMQKGLDKAGVSMPNFSGMGANFGAEPEPEPEPVETEDERIDRELQENETSIAELQSQMRGALIRLRLGDSMEGIYNEEEWIIDLQSRIRGEFARQISDYRMQMQRFATDLQRYTKGYLVRSKEKHKEQFWINREPDIIKLQSLVRSRKARNNVQILRSDIRKHDIGIRTLQAAVRGALYRARMDDQQQETKDSEANVRKLQAAIRGYLQRRTFKSDTDSLDRQQKSIRSLQAVIRGAMARKRNEAFRSTLEHQHNALTSLQCNARGALLRRKLDAEYASLQEHIAQIKMFQAVARASQIRENFMNIRKQLTWQNTCIVQLQAIARSHLLRKAKAADLVNLRLESKPTSQFQGFARGYMLRQRVFEQRRRLFAHAQEIIKLQAGGRAALIRARLEDDYGSLEAEEETITQLQAAIRGKLVRVRFAEKKQFFKQNMEKVIKLQSFVRARQQGEAYKSLMNGKNPPVGTVKNFVHLLNDSDFDFEEEIESERVRKSVVLRVRQNELMEQYIEELDTKIGLVQNLKNRRDELAKLQKHHGGNINNLLITNRDMSKNAFNFKALDKSSKKKVEQYQELFFTLQTQPQYLARLFKRVRERGMADEESKRLESLTMSMFGFAQKRREEYYLLKLIIRAIKEEADGCSSIQEFQRGSFFWSRLFGNYSRSPRDRKFLRELFGPFIKARIVESTDLDLESDPLQIYRTAISNEELRTGQRSSRNPDISREEAIREPETRSIFIHHLQDLRDISDSFITTLEELIERMPYTVRYTAQQMYTILASRFPDDDRQDILQIVGNWLWRAYLKPGITEPETTGTVDRGLGFAHKRNLGEFAKVINQIAAGRPFGGENDCLKPLNSYITDAVSRLQSIWAHAIDVKDADSKFDIDEFNDLYARNKPTLFIKLADVFAIHHTVATEISYICTSHEDGILREVVHDLGNAKSNEAEMMNTNSSEITLHLSPKLHNLDDPEGPIKTLFMETKRCVLYIIRIQSGNSLLEIMVKPITAEDEQRWDALVHEEVAADNRKHGAYSDAKNLIDIASLSYTELKRIALENILTLEQANRLTRSNQYQDLLNEIASDIRTKHRRRVQRQRELEAVRATLSNLEEKSVWLEDKLKVYNDAFEQNLTTLQNKKGKKRFLMPFSKQWDHERELARMGKIPRFGSYKYSGEALAEKGILVEWKGVSLRDNDLILSSDEVGVFHIEGSCGNLMLPGASATFTWDDMLAAGYNSQQYLTFFENAPGSGVLKLNANLLQTQVSKKFWRND